MARRKKTAKRKTGGRRRVSGVALSAKSPLVKFGSIAAGYFLGDKINDSLASATGSIDPKIIAAAEAVGGFLIQKKVKGVVGAVAGGILMGAGLKKGLTEFGVISGLPLISGYQDLRTINGLPESVQQQSVNNNLSVISGVESAYTDCDR